MVAIVLLLSDDKTTTAGGPKLFIEAMIEAISDDDTLNFAPRWPADGSQPIIPFRT